MDDPRWIRLVTIGLVLSAIAVGYFLISGKFTSNTKTQGQVSRTSPSPSTRVLGQNVDPVTQATSSAFERVAERTQNGVATLPATGFPMETVYIFSVGVAVAGWGLRKYPH